MNSNLRNLLLLLLLACCWGPSFLFIKLALESFGPLTLVNCRLILGAVMLYAVLKFKGMEIFSYRHRLFDFLVVAIFSCSLRFSLISMGEVYISSSLAAIINSTVPIFTAIIAHFFVANERLSVSKIAGILISFVGMLVVFLPAVLNQIVVDDIGTFLVFIASICYAIGMTYARRFLREIPFLVTATFQLIVASIIMLPFSLVIEQPYLLPMPKVSAMFGVFGLAFFGTALAFNTFYKLVQSASATYLATSTLLFPIIGIALGALVLGEHLEWNAYAGSAIIFLGLMVTNRLVEPARISFLKTR